MNKTVNINLGGMFFHIDEDAYQKLSRYFEAIKRSLSNSSGQDEIIKDIEMRVSELLTEKQKSEKHVVGLKDVDEVIAVMGQPEDYRIDDEEAGNKSTNFSSTGNSGKLKKLYRDRDNGMIGGVLAGLGHYFGIDKVWLRIFLLVMIFFYGTGLLAYLILWIVMPEAVTTSEKIEMTGEPVNISNIEKKVREEFDNVSDKLKNSGDILKDQAKHFNYNYGEKINQQTRNIGSTFGDFIITILKVFSKFLGVMLIMGGLTVIFFLLVGIFTLGSNIFIDFPWQSFIESGNYSDYPAWTFGLLMFFAVGIPFFFLTFLGFKLLSPKTKSLGNVAIFTLIAIWIISIAISISVGITQATAFSNDGRIVLKEKININPTDTLFVKFVHNDFFAKNIDEDSSFKITQDSTSANVIYSNNVTFRVQKTDEKTPYIQIEKEAKGKSLSEAKKKAEQIRYGYKIVGSHLILDNYLLTDLKNKFRDQEIEIILFVPEGTLLKADASVQNYDRSDDDFFNLHYSSSDYIYKVESNKVKCLNCPADENEYNDLEENSDDDIDIQNPNVTINKDGISIQNDTTISNSKNFKELKISKDGIIIKTK
jgi:phage shock protein PspC (stress-responsive transcriptional regulator)